MSVVSDVDKLLARIAPDGPQDRVFVETASGNIERFDEAEIYLVPPGTERGEDPLPMVIIISPKRAAMFRNPSAWWIETDVPDGVEPWDEGNFTVWLLTMCEVVKVDLDYPDENVNDRVVGTVWFMHKLMLLSRDEVIKTVEKRLADIFKTVDVRLDFGS